MVKNLSAKAGGARDAGSVSGSGRTLSEGNGNPLQYPCLESPMDRGASRATVHEVTKSQTCKCNYKKHTSAYIYIIQVNMLLLTTFRNLLTLFLLEYNCFTFIIGV